MEAFLVSAGIVAIAEMGDKTQIATVALAARYVPAVFLGERLLRRVPEKAVRRTAAAIFAPLGALADLRF